MEHSFSNDAISPTKVIWSWRRHLHVCLPPFKVSRLSNLWRGRWKNDGQSATYKLSCKKIYIKYKLNMKVEAKYKQTNRRGTSWKKSLPLSLWAMEMNFLKFRYQILLINLSSAFIIVFQISRENLRASRVASRYNLAAVFVALDSFF